MTFASLVNRRAWAECPRTSVAAHALLAALALLAPGSASSGPLHEQCAPLFWMDRTLSTVVKFQQNPIRAARNLGYVAVALDRAAVAARAAGHSTEVVQSGAAGALLDYLYPYSTPGGFRALARVWLRAGAPPEPRGLEADLALGEAVAEVLVQRALHDGADRRWDPSTRPPPAPGRWRVAPPLNLYSPVEPLAGRWRTWVIGDPASLTVPAPVPYDSERFWAETAEVLETARLLTAEQKALADQWHMDQGSVTPPGVWNREALGLLAGDACDPGQAARTLATLNAAMADALVAAWYVKYAYWTERPVTAIRERLDAEFLPYLFTPPFPAYVSGHASVSAAAARALGHFFPDRAAGLQTMAQSAADSRLYGGIHFRSDNEEGLRLGEQVGEKVLRSLVDGRPPWLD